jgi:hypothetical protein
MDVLLDQRLRAEQAPFAGQTLAPTEMLPLEGLCQALRIVFDVLHRRGRERPLCVLLDRHEADGRATRSREEGWEWLARLVADPATLYRQRSGETLVSLGFYQGDPSFYLRTYVMVEDEDEDYPGRWGDFDLSGDALLIREVQRGLSSLGIELEVESSGQYFQRRSAE